jgi:hypothetical protein
VRGGGASRYAPRGVFELDLDRVTHLLIRSSGVQHGGGERRVSRDEGGLVAVATAGDVQTAGWTVVGDRRGHVILPLPVPTAPAHAYVNKCGRMRIVWPLSTYECE